MPRSAGVIGQVISTDNGRVQFRAEGAVFDSGALTGVFVQPGDKVYAGFTKPDQRRGAVVLGPRAGPRKEFAMGNRIGDDFIGFWQQAEVEPGLSHVAVRPCHPFSPFQGFDDSIKTILDGLVTEEGKIGAILGICVVDDIVDGQVHIAVATVEQVHDNSKPSGQDTAGTYLRLYILETQSGDYQVIGQTEYHWAVDWSGRGGPLSIGPHLHYNPTERYFTVIAPQHLVKPAGSEPIVEGGRLVWAVRFNFDFNRDLVLVESDVSETGHPQLGSSCFYNIVVKNWHFQGTPASLPEAQLPYKDNLIRGYVRKRETRFRPAMKNKLEETWGVDPREVLGLGPSDIVVNSIITGASEGKEAPEQDFLRRFPYNTLDKRFLLWVSGLQVSAEEGAAGSIQPRKAVAQIRSIEPQLGQEFGTVNLIIDAQASPSRDASTIDPLLPPSLADPYSTGLRFSDSGYNGDFTAYRQPNPTGETIVGPGFVSSPPGYPGDDIAWAAWPSEEGFATKEQLLEAGFPTNPEIAALSWNDLTGSPWSVLVSATSEYAGEATHQQFFTPGGSLEFWYNEDNLPFTEEEMAAFKAQFEPLRREPDYRTFTNNPGNKTGALRQLPWQGEHDVTTDLVQAPSGWIGTGTAEDVKKLYILYAEPYQLLSGIRRFYQELSGFRRIFFRVRRRDSVPPYDFPSGDPLYIYERGSPSGLLDDFVGGPDPNDDGNLANAQVFFAPHLEILHRRKLICVNLTQNGLSVDWVKVISSYNPNPVVHGQTSDTARELDTDAFQVVPFRDKVVLFHTWAEYPAKPFPTLVAEVIGATDNGFTDGGETWSRHILLPGAFDEDAGTYTGEIEQFDEDTTIGEGDSQELWLAKSYHWRFQAYWPVKGGISPLEALKNGSGDFIDTENVPWWTLEGLLYHRPTQKYHTGRVTARFCPFGTNELAPLISWEVSGEHIGGGTGISTDTRWLNENAPVAMAFWNQQGQGAWANSSIVQTNQQFG